MNSEGLIEIDDWVDPYRIEPPHEVRDADKYTDLIRVMLIDGWTGRPLLISKSLMVSLTGSHRIAAAREANVDIPIMYINEDLEIDDGWDDDDRLSVLREHGDKRAAALMAVEIEKN